MHTYGLMHDFNRILSIDVFSKLLIFESQFHSIHERCPIQHIGVLFPFVFITILQEAQ